MIAYFDCFSGISGDMTLGAFIDLGVPVDWLNEQIAALGLPGARIETEPVMRAGIRANRVHVRESESPPARNYADIRELLEKSALAAEASALAVKMFHRLAEAEARIHGCAVDDVHFHEVGAVDAIVDVAGAALSVQHLGIRHVRAAPPPLGSGTIESAHGTLPVPAPATMELLRGIPVKGGHATGEMVTPTGAAILTTLADTFGPIPEMVVERIGYGAGTRDPEHAPNVLRILLGSPSPAEDRPELETQTMVETCIDDMNPEIFGYLMECLFGDGALDVYWVPVFMKKNRPGTMVHVLCPAARKSAVIDRLLAETTTLGVRSYPVERHVLAREIVTVDTVYGRTPVKEVRGLGGSIRRVPEYEFCRRIAREKDIPIREVYDAILKSLG